MNTRFDVDLIRRANEMYAPKPKVVDPNVIERRKLKIRHSIYLYNKKNKEKLRDGAKKRAENGKERERQRLRYEQLRMASEGLTKSEKRKIRDFYYATPEGYCVDHIIPISQGGLHRFDNLQYLTLSENSSKKNKVGNWVRPYYLEDCKKDEE